VFTDVRFFGATFDPPDTPAPGAPALRTACAAASRSVLSSAALRRAAADSAVLTLASAASKTSARSRSRLP
jgi:hypothetical protein